MVETAEISEMVQSLGATYGQGWHFGKPTPKPTWRMPLAAVEVIENGRRRGVVEQWG
jgi:EAL domain-containing protein (putative c-di-GMP-specific phosphodiesterase class I)